MKTVGLITEYNPFHNGHKYHIERALEITGADIAITVMSGSFVQRGEPAVIDKYSRAKMALQNGVSLVVELPVVYSCSSAEYFSYGSIMTLASLGVDSVCFGSECGDIDILSYIADLLLNETPSLSAKIRDRLASGLSYPKARNDALCEYIEENTSIYDRETIENALNSPNNVLGIEYIKTIMRYDLPIKPYTIKRVGSGYNVEDIITDIPSATAIRKAFSMDISSGVSNELSQKLSVSVPDSVYSILTDSLGINFPVCIDDFTVMLNTKLQYIIHTDYTKLTDYLDVGIDLSNKLVNVFTGNQTFTQLVEALKSKELTYSRVCRCLMHILLEITDMRAAGYNHTGTIPYIRLLGFNDAGRSFLNTAKKDCIVPLITKTAGNKELLSEDIFATELYNAAVYYRFGTKLPDEYRRGPVIL